VSQIPQVGFIRVPTLERVILAVPLSAKRSERGHEGFDGLLLLGGCNRDFHASVWLQAFD
jgi:hypothetical protein